MLAQYIIFMMKLAAAGFITLAVLALFTIPYLVYKMLKED